MASTYSQIATQTLGSAASSVTFSSIPQTYTNLVLISVCSTSRVSSNASVDIQFNSDTSTNYSNTFMYGDGTTTTSSRASNATSIWIGQTIGNSSTNPEIQITNINNYNNTTTYKTVLSRGNHPSQLVLASVGLWRNTAAITSIKLINEGGNNFIAGNTFTLYGIKGA